MYVPEAEVERTNRESPYYEASRGLAMAETFEDATITRRVLDFVGADADRRFDAHRRRVFGENGPALLTPDEANERFGVPGRLSFDAPVDQNIAAWRQSEAQRGAFRDEVVANAGLSWWETMGTAFAGSVFDPLGLPLWLVPELAAGRAMRSGAAASRLARMPAVARGAIVGGVEGVAGGVVYEGANLWLHHAAADDYDFGQASANVLLGGLIGAGAGGVGGWWESRAGRTVRPPAALEGLSEPARMGAIVQAVTDVLEDRPVDLAPVLRRAIETGELRSRNGVGPDLEDGAVSAAARAEGWRDRVPASVDVDAVMTPARWEGMAEPDRLAWLADDQLRAERGRLAVMEEALGPVDAPAAALKGSTRSDLEVEVARSRDRIAELEAVVASGDLSADLGLRSLARAGGSARRPSVARTLSEGLNAWYAKPGDAPGPVAKPKARPAKTAEAGATAQGRSVNAAREPVPKPKVAKGAAAPVPKGEPFADPEIAALAADTEAMLLREGLTLDDVAGPDPQSVADAIVAGAFCLRSAA